MFEGRHGDPNIFFTFEFPEDKTKAGDLYLASVVLELKEDPRKKGVFVIGSPEPWNADSKDADKLISEAQLPASGLPPVKANFHRAKPFHH